MAAHRSEPSPIDLDLDLDLAAWKVLRMADSLAHAGAVTPSLGMPAAEPLPFTRDALVDAALQTVSVYLTGGVIGSASRFQGRIDTIKVHAEWPMSDVVSELSKRARELAPSERARLAEDLLASLGEDLDPQADAAWDAELRQRIDDVAEGRLAPLPASEVFANARRQLR